MKILHVNFSDNQGGAAKAALRIILAQRRAGLDAQMLVVVKSFDFDFVHKVSFFYKLRIKLVSKLSVHLLRIINKSTNPILHSLNLCSSGVYKQINSFDADIVHLHWINFDMLSVNEIAKIKTPIVWTLHDSWPFCGSEHHPNGMDDRAFLNKYSPNPYSGFNVNKFILRQKINAWKNLNITVVAPSKWESQCAKHSLVFQNKLVQTIPNCLNLNVFKPIEKRIARSILNLSSGKKYILFGADGGPSNPIKGGDLLIDILKYYINNYFPKGVELLVFGSSHHSSFINLGLPVHFLGQIHDEVAMSLIYNVADVMLIPSRMDNFPQTATEPLACGVPIVCFNIGGLVDIVDHKLNGYIANHFDISDFARGIDWVLSEADYESLVKSARSKSLTNYNEGSCVLKYSNIYQNLV